MAAANYEEMWGQGTIFLMRENIACLYADVNDLIKMTKMGDSVKRKDNCKSHLSCVSKWVVI